MQTDPFYEVYDRQNIAYGLEPSVALESFIRQCGPVDGRAIDLGAGGGRDTIFLARHGFEVTAVDRSNRGLERIVQRAQQDGFADRIETLAKDVRQIDLPVNHYDVVVATTMLDHIELTESRRLFDAMALSLVDGGVMYVEVHTTEDPGSGQWPGGDLDYPISETADSVINYFAPNRLVQMAAQPRASLRVLHYEERLEWDQTHGSPHAHGKAVLLAVRAGHHPRWEGVYRPFPLPKQ